MDRYPDRDEVIRALKYCMIWDGDCSGCPYDGRCQKNLFALEKDIIFLLSDVNTDYKRVETYHDENDDEECPVWKCMECSEKVVCHGSERPRWDYCPVCGRRIIWHE